MTNVYETTHYRVAVNDVEGQYDVVNSSTDIVEYSSPVLPQAMLVASQFTRMLSDEKIIPAMVNAAYQWTSINFDDEGVLQMDTASIN